MAEAKLQYNVSLDDESKELIRQLVKAVDRIADAQAPEADVSFGDHGKRLIEEPTLTGVTHRYGTYSYPTAEQRARIRELLDGEGDHLLHDDGHEGEDTE